MMKTASELQLIHLCRVGMALNVLNDVVQGTLDFYPPSSLPSIPELKKMIVEMRALMPAGICEDTTPAFGQKVGPYDHFLFDPDLSLDNVEKEAFYLTHGGRNHDQEPLTPEAILTHYSAQLIQIKKLRKQFTDKLIQLFSTGVCEARAALGGPVFELSAHLSVVATERFSAYFESILPLQATMAKLYEQNSKKKYWTQLKSKQISRRELDEKTTHQLNVLHYQEMLAKDAFNNPRLALECLLNFITSYESCSEKRWLPVGMKEDFYVIGNILDFIKTHYSNEDYRESVQRINASVNNSLRGDPTLISGTEYDICQKFPAHVQYLPRLKFAP